MHGRDQESIFAADDDYDRRSQCEISGEPVIQTMLPTEDAHGSNLSEPFVRSLVGENGHPSAYDVRPFVCYRVYTGH